VELITPYRTNTNYHETRKGGQGPVWAVAPLHHHQHVTNKLTRFSLFLNKAVNSLCLHKINVHLTLKCNGEPVIEKLINHWKAFVIASDFIGLILMSEMTVR
jgi:hypothetical protein